MTGTQAVLQTRISPRAYCSAVKAGVSAGRTTDGVPYRSGVHSSLAPACMSGAQLMASAAALAQYRLGGAIKTAMASLLSALQGWLPLRAPLDTPDA